MFSGRASLGPTGRRTYSTQETPALSDREQVLKKVGQKVGDVLVVPATLSGSTPLRLHVDYTVTPKCFEMLRDIVHTYATLSLV